MRPDIRWITPLYNFSTTCTHIGVPENALKKLQDMASDLVDTSGLAAIYVPEGAPDVYNPGSMRGRVVGAVRLLQMPPGKTVSDYFYKDWDGSMRWPFGWPCEAVYAPPVGQCPTLRDAVDHVHPRSGFSTYVHQFLKGPIELDSGMRTQLSRDFTELDPLIPQP